METAEKPAIIFVGSKRKQVRRKGPPLQPQDLSSGVPEAVLDTNVVFDWLVFADPGVTRLFAAVQDRAVRWVATEAMLDELRHVLGRPPLLARRPQALEDAIAARCTVVDTPPEVRRTLLCSDPDDQKFIDLALHRRTPWLISRDRALLKLARRARPHGVQVCPPAHWSPPDDSAPKTPP
jgi:putative PIN family toxin of toxin-antitoxin system